MRRDSREVLLFRFRGRNGQPLKMKTGLMAWELEERPIRKTLTKLKDLRTLGVSPWAWGKG